MKSLHIHRFAEVPDGIIGRSSEGWFTLENDLKDIPAMVYRCKRDYYHAGDYETFEVTNVPGRSRILIHKGNVEDDSAGCILLGKTLGVYKNKIAVLNSGKAFREFMHWASDVDEFNLIITEQ